ncbi:MAG: ExbD/TolR family protein, partial [Gammaproteobacteria bacterium]
MSMQVGTGSGDSMEVMLDINTTPLIDVMLVLLIMLIMTIPIQSDAVKLDMPRPNQNPPTTTPTVVELVI